MSEHQTHLTTGQVAQHFGLPPWKVSRLYERRLVEEPPRLARQRMIPAGDLPRLRDALVQAGYMPAETASASGKEV